MTLCVGFHEQWFRGRCRRRFGEISSPRSFVFRFHRLRGRYHKAWCEHVDTTLPLCSEEQDDDAAGREK